MSNIFDALKLREKRARRTAGAGAVGTAPPAVRPAAKANVPPAARLTFRVSRELEKLRERVDLEIPRTGRRVIAVAAAVAGEGSSTVSLQLARTMAIGGTGSVLLVDGDLGRRGRSLTRAIGSAEGRAGLVEVLGGTIELSKAILSTDEANLHFLPAGGAAGQAVDAVPLDRMRQFLDDMGNVYRLVIVDCPSILENPEVPAIIALTDGIVLVVRANSTRREVVQRALLLMRSAHCRVLGVVLNRRRYPIPEFIYRRL